MKTYVINVAAALVLVTIFASAGRADTYGELDGHIGPRFPDTHVHRPPPHAR